MGGAEEGGEEEGKSKANKYRAWAVGWDISTREAHAVNMQCTNVKYIHGHAEEAGLRRRRGRLRTNARSKIQAR